MLLIVATLREMGSNPFVLLGTQAGEKLSLSNLKYMYMYIHTVS